MNVPSVDQFLGFCQGIEDSIATVKGAIPSYFADSTTVLMQQESGLICNNTYLQSDPAYAKACEQALNGLLLNGLDAAMSYLIAII